MADYTVNYAWPYPTGGDSVAVHSDIEKLAKAADATAKTMGSDIADLQASEVSVTYLGDGVYEIN